MRALGLFVGVDVQQDDAIRQLTFAGRDAEVLCACFADANEAFAGGSTFDEADTILLVGEAATRTAVCDALKTLAARSEAAQYELALIHFSCHGTPEGILLLTDAEDGAEASTGLAIDDLAARVAEIAASQVIIAFDTCFSGLAAGRPRVRHDEAEAKNGGLAQRLWALGHGNRAVVMAAQAAEQAWETSRLGHGLLSYGLLRGLDGTTLRRADGTISISEWIQLAVKVVLDESAKEGVSQNPKRFFEWTADPAMPAFRPGRRRAALDARSVVHQVGTDPADLASYGIRPGVRDAIRQLMRGAGFNPLQCRAVNAGGVLAGNSVVVAAPTASGKTMIGYLAAVGTVARRGRAVVLLPSRALANEKWLEFHDAFEPHGVRAVRSFGGVDDDDAALHTNHYGVAFLTYEKFLTLVLMRPRMLDTITTLVLDEVHLLGDSERGRTVELLLTHLRRRAALYRPTQIVALSAALGTLNGFPEWLGATLIAEHERPVPLQEGVVSPSGRFRYLDSATGQEHVLMNVFPTIPEMASGETPRDVCERVAVALGKELLARNGECVLAFRFSRPDTRALAAAYAHATPLGRCGPPLDALQVNATGREDSLASTELFARLERGVAFHISDLGQHEREAIERAFRSRELRALVATSGLAMGVNTPATSVIIVDHMKFVGEEKPYSVAEMKNMAGRAGRMIDGGRPGVSYLCAVSDQHADELFAAYVLSTPEPLVSRMSELHPDDLALALLVLTGRTRVEDLLEVAKETFEGFQRQRDATWRRERRAQLRDAVMRLTIHGFVIGHDDGTVEPTLAGRVLGRTGLTAESARRAIAAAREILAAGEVLDERAFVALAQLTGELQQDVYTPAKWHEGAKWASYVNEKLLADREATLRVMVAPGDAKLSAQRLKRFYAVGRWLLGDRIDIIERGLSRFSLVIGRAAPDPAAGLVRQAADRTASVLRSLGKVLALSFPDLADEIRGRVLALLPRLEVGVHREAATLARYRLRLSRGEIRALRDAGVTDFEPLRDALRAQRDDVVAIFGSSRAAAVLATMDRRAARARRVQEADYAAQVALFDGQADDLAPVTEF
jgi:replicative superfamily II helicase